MTQKIMNWPKVEQIESPITSYLNFGYSNKNCKDFHNVPCWINDIKVNKVEKRFTPHIH